MKIYTCLLVLLSSLARLDAAEIHFYLGTYTDQSGSKGIYEGSLDEDTGKLGPITLAAPASDPSFLTLSPKGDFLYAALEHWDKGEAGAFRRTGDGKLTPLNTQPATGADSCHVSTDLAGRNVFVANYNSGNIVRFPVQPDGSLGAEAVSIPLTGSGPNPERQQSSHAHCACPSADGNYLYACDLGSDRVWIFKLSATGDLTPNDPPFAQVPAGSGPRHLAFSGDSRFVYVASELGHNVTVFARNLANGGLKPLQTLSVLTPELSNVKAATAEVVVHPSGKYLYVSSRFCNTISVFKIVEDGKLSLIQTASAQVQGPRSFAIDPSGRWLIAGGQDDNRIVELRIDPATGRLSTTRESAQVGSPVCVLFQGR